MKKFLILFLMAFFTVPVIAQNTSVLATVTDSDGNVWSNAAYTITFNNPSQGQPPVYKGTGTRIQTVFKGTLNSSGVLSVTIPDNLQVDPRGTWNFQLCSNTSAACTTITSLTVTGASINLTTVLSAGVIAPRFACINTCYGYNSNEVTNSNLGAIFTNTNSPVTSYMWNGSTFTLLVNTVGGLPLTGGTLTGPLTAPSVNNVLSYTNFGAKCDGSTDDSTAFNSIGTYAAGVTGGKTVTVEFPPNATCVIASTITTWLRPNLHLEFRGTRLKFTGTGHAITLHNTSGEIDNWWLKGLVLQGNSGADYGIYSDTLIARGQLDVTNIQDFTTGCAYLGNMQLMDKVNVSCSSIKATAMGVPQTTAPTNGLILGDTAVSGYFANNRHVNFTVEGTGSGDGVHCIRCTNGNVFTGTTEHTSSVGVMIDSASSLNTFLGFDSEQNTTEDFQDSGTDDTFINALSDGLTEIMAASVRSHLLGGWYNSIAIDSGAKSTTLDSLQYNISNTGSLNVASTAFPSLRNVYNAQTGALSQIPTGPFTVSNFEQSGQSSNAAARNWEWLPDYVGNGWYSLYRSSTNTGTPSSGSDMLDFDTGGNLIIHAGLNNGAGTLIPSSATGFQGSATGKIVMNDQLPTNGTVTLSGGTATVSTTKACTPSSTCSYQLTHCSNSGTLGQLIVTTISVGTSFTIGDTSGTDTSNVCWSIIP